MIRSSRVSVAWIRIEKSGCLSRNEKKESILLQILLWDAMSHKKVIMGQT